MDAGQISPGVICDKSIEDVFPDELRGFDRCHFFAGLGGWERALNLAGWGERPVWTGSAPCQPFSVAGKGLGFDDPRHLWPSWYWLIKERRPAIVFGEQVAAATDWLGLVRHNLEALEYAVGAMPIEAASTGAEHFRDRCWFVADSSRQRGKWSASRAESSRCAIAAGDRSSPLPHRYDAKRRPDDTRGDVDGGKEARRLEGASDIAERSACHVVDDSSFGWGEGWTEHEFRSRGFAASVASIDGCQYVECPDGKWRRLPPPRVRWLGNGIPARVAKLRALGNAIDPRPAAEFIKAAYEAITE